MLNVVNVTASQVPLFLRKTVLSYASIPSDNGNAYEENGHISLFGSLDLDVFVHESTHAYDWTHQVNGNWLSGQSAYLQVRLIHALLLLVLLLLLTTFWLFIGGSAAAAAAEHALVLLSSLCAFKVDASAYCYWR